MTIRSSSEDQALKGLQSQNAKALFDKIDELRSLGVGGLVELPQLIVCGEQSSGKSSVLEAISRVRFPTKTKLCTRFATEVILRRSPEPKFKVSIDPGESRTDEEIEKLREFSMESFPDGSDDTPFQELIEKAEEWMGIDRSGDSATGFSDDVLKVEISGPEKPELTLVDLPGLYRAKSKEQSTEGINFVQNITRRYMENPRSIILAVLSAKSNYVSQDILDRAEHVDPKLERVLAIVTSPDLIDSGSEVEDEWLNYIRNDDDEKPRLKLGWHVLRNRNYEERNTDDDLRDKLERKFFETGKWPTLSRESVGIQSLRHRLSHILFNHVRRNLPGLVQDIERKIENHRRNLAKLGSPRSTLQEQRSYLIEISNNFSRIVENGLNGAYRHDFFNEKDDDLDSSDQDNRRRLRATIRDLNEYFFEAITVRGSYRRIIYNDTKNEEPYFVSFGTPGFEDYMNCWIPKDVGVMDLVEETKKEAHQKRGLELPANSNPLLVEELFRQQTIPWERIARLHIEKACDAVSKFAYAALKFLTDTPTYQAILRDIVAPELEGLRSSVLQKLEELTRHSTYGHPLPVRRLFLEKIQHSRRDRQLFLLRKELGKIRQGKEDPNSFTDEDLAVATTKSTLESTDTFAAIDTIDQAQAYYETYLTTFIDNIVILAIENCLLIPLGDIFTSLAVSNMESKTIRSLAEEPPHVQADRNRYSNQLEKLEAGLKTLNILNREDSSLSTPIVFVSRSPSPSPFGNGKL